MPDVVLIHLQSAKAALNRYIVSMDLALYITNNMVKCYFMQLA